MESEMIQILELSDKGFKLTSGKKLNNIHKKMRNFGEGMKMLSQIKTLGGKFLDIQR